MELVNQDTAAYNRQTGHTDLAYMPLIKLKHFHILNHNKLENGHL